MSDKVIIFDTTLRDGEQSTGATMLLQEKIAVAQLLDNMGVDVMEAGFAAASIGDSESIQEISKNVNNSVICSLARGIKSDIEKAAEALKYAKKPRIHTFISTSDIHIEYQFKKTRDEVLDIIHDTVSYAKSFYDDIEWSAMDATRSDIEFLTKAVGVAVNAGAKTINVPDTVGYTTPLEYQKIFEVLSTTYPDTIFSTHCHNDLGLAVANSLAGVQGGARQIECTVNGVGERAGNAALEEVVMALQTRKDFYQTETNIDTTKLYPTSRMVAAVTGFTVQKNKAIVGANAFSHESGIHQDGMLKNRNTYEIMSAETVGADQTQLVLGKHSGRAALKDKVVKWGIALSDDELQEVFEEFKALCDRKKTATEEDLMSIIQHKLVDGDGDFINLKKYNIAYNDDETCDATVTLSINNQEQTINQSGNGQLDAVYKCINTTVPDSENKLELLDLEIHSIAYGTDAQAESKVVMAYDGQRYLGHARDVSTVKSAVNAYISAVNKIIVSINK